MVPQSLEPLGNTFSISQVLLLRMTVELRRLNKDLLATSNQKGVFSDGRLKTTAVSRKGLADSVCNGGIRERQGGPPRDRACSETAGLSNHCWRGSLDIKESQS